MDYVNYFTDLLKFIPDYRKFVLLIFLLQIDKYLFREIGFNELDNNCLNLEFKNFLVEQYEEYFEYVKNQEESIVERFLNN